MRKVTNHVPKGDAYGRRTGQRIEASTITIHNTGNERSTAANERAWLTNPSNVARASYHVVIDEREVIECIPLNERAIHSGTSAGNLTSIGVEICESGDYGAALRNAVVYVAEQLRERGWGVNRLRRHYDWSGKICPRLMYDGGTWKGWAEFKAAVAAELAGKEAKSDVDKATVTVNGRRISDGLYDAKAGVVYVPVRAVAEEFGASVAWDGKAKRVEITRK